MTPKKTTKPRKSASKKSTKRPARTRKKGAKSGKTKRPIAKKRSAKKGGSSGSRKGPARKSFTAKMKRWLITELWVWTAGIICGMGLLSVGLWQVATTEVSSYLQNPPRTHPGVIYSAPYRISDGQRINRIGLAGELLSAGFERVNTVSKNTKPGSFSLTKNTFIIVNNDGDKGEVTLTNERVSRVSPRGGVKIKPSVLATIGDTEGRRSDISLDQISPHIQAAVLAMEDSRFRDHHGIDPIGIARAIYHNLASSGGIHGGSTLTQQLAKNLFLSADRTMKRKVREAFFAAALEATLSKDEILEIYLGEVYLGQSGGLPLHGVEQASRAWFGRSASKVTLRQAAAIAGTVSAPNRYSPARHPEESNNRQKIVLQRMMETKDITAEEVSRALASDLGLQHGLIGAIRRAPWAVDMAVDIVESTLGEGTLANSGLEVYTTIDPLLQQAAEWAVQSGMAELDRDYPKAKGAQVALVAVRVSDGSIAALVGGRDYSSSQFNRVTSAWRSPGSLVKPLTMLAAFDQDQNLSPISMLDDEPIQRKGPSGTWAPKNYDGTYLGPVTIRKTIEGSRNIPSIKLAEQVGLTELKRRYQNVGLSKATSWPSSSLGAFEATPLEIAGAYTSFPSGGIYHPPRIISRIEKAGEVTGSIRSRQAKRVASERAAALATSILRGVITDGTGARATRYGVSGPVGGKTGTTDDYRDAWFAGFTPELAVAVWVGRDKGGSVGLSGSRAAIPTWARFVSASGTLQGNFVMPDNVIERQVCIESNQAAVTACPNTYHEHFSANGDDPTDCDIHGSVVQEIGSKIRDLFQWRD